MIVLRSLEINLLQPSCTCFVLFTVVKVPPYMWSMVVHLMYIYTQKVQLISRPTRLWEVKFELYRLGGLESPKDIIDTSIGTWPDEIFLVRNSLLTAITRNLEKKANNTHQIIISRYRRSEIIMPEGNTSCQYF